MMCHSRVEDGDQSTPGLFRMNSPMETPARRTVRAECGTRSTAACGGGRTSAYSTGGISTPNEGALHGNVLIFPVCSSGSLNAGRNVSTSACNGRTIMSVAEMTSDLLPIRASSKWVFEAQPKTQSAFDQARDGGGEGGSKTPSPPPLASRVRSNKTKTKVARKDARAADSCREKFHDSQFAPISSVLPCTNFANFWSCLVFFFNF